MKILISTCLIGCRCRYDGRKQRINLANSLPKEYTLIPFCPEQAGGLPTPRVPCEIVGTKVLDRDGEDRTKEFDLGAEEALNICRIFNIENAILKSKSPSCGFGEIYDGSFTGKLILGNGITADLLSKNNIAIYNENNYKEIFL